MISKVGLRGFMGKSSKLMLGIILAVISMIFSYVSIYEISTSEITEYTVLTENFYEKYVFDLERAPFSITYSQIIINSTFDMGSGILQIRVENANGSVYKKSFEYSPNKNMTLLNLKDDISEVVRVKVLINAYSPTKGKIIVTTKGTSQPYYYLSIIAIPIVILSIVFFAIGMYESLVKIKEEEKRRKMRWI